MPDFDADRAVRKRPVWLILSAGLFLLQACASQGTPAGTTSGIPVARSHYVCANDAATGSHVKKNQCMTQEQAKAKSEQDQKKARGLVGVGTNGPTGSSSKTH